MHSRLPSGFTSLVVCDTRRSREWREALERAGFEVALAETAAGETRGGWEVGVANRFAREARVLVSEVAQGKRTLTQPMRGWLLSLLLVPLLALGFPLCVPSIETRPRFSLEVVDASGNPRPGATVTFVSGDGWGPRPDRRERLPLDRIGRLSVDAIHRRVFEAFGCGEGRRRDAWVCVRERGHITVAEAVAATPIRVVLAPLAPGATDDPDGICDELQRVRELARRR